MVRIKKRVVRIGMWVCENKWRGTDDTNAMCVGLQGNLKQGHGITERREVSLHGRGKN